MKRRPAHIQIKCPYPDCGHICSMITFVHAEREHGITKKELFEKYGEPEPVSYDPIAFKENKKIKSIYTNNYSNTSRWGTQGSE